MNGLRAALGAAVCPDETDTLLLRACLLDGPAARQAWDAWCTRAGDPKVLLETETRGLKGMLPMIDAAFRRHGLPGPPGLGTYLKAATLREELRTRLIAGFLAGVLDAFETNGIGFTLLGGIASAHAVYPSPVQRHCHAIDLLVPEKDLAPAALGRAGFTPLAGSATEFRHTDGLALHLWPDIAFHPHHRAASAGIAGRAAGLDLGSRVVPAACPTDRFLMALSRAASTSERGNLRWACDAYLTAPHVDWRLFLAEAERRHMALPLGPLCRYLAEQLGAAVPAGIVARLDALPETPLDREAALAGALTGLSATRRAMAAPGVDPATRLAIVRYLALPSARCMAWEYGPAGGLSRIAQRLHRPFAYAASRLRRRLAH